MLNVEYFVTCSEHSMRLPKSLKSLFTSGPLTFNTVMYFVMLKQGLLYDQLELDQVFKFKRLSFQTI